MRPSTASDETASAQSLGDEPALRVTGLTVRASTGAPIIEGVSLSVKRGEILGIVGESGSGKTTTALALLGYTQPSARITDGFVDLQGQRLDPRDKQSARQLRGGIVSYVPQNPGTALNPTMRIGDAIAEMFRTHRDDPFDASLLPGLLAAVGLPTSEDFLRRFPHQLSGGQQQRVCIAVALVAEPPVVVLDEPTTGLDVVTQAKILQELVRLRTERNLAMVYVTHDLAVVSQLADRVAVMYAGRIVEEGPVRQVLTTPRHAYTAELLAAIPDHLRPARLKPLRGSAVGVGAWPKGCAFAARCSLRVDACEEQLPALALTAPEHHSRCIRAADVTLVPADPRLLSAPADQQPPVLEVVGLRAEHRGRRGSVVAAEGIDFEARRGECVALVGESGSGKTTIARVIAGLHVPSGGRITLDGEPLAPTARRRTREQRRLVQIVLQNPTDSLNPRQTIEEAISRPLRSLRGLRRSAASAEVTRLLESVRLSERVRSRYPAELSGGERQRVAIARGLAAEPKVLICDEITSALDVSVQSAILMTLDDLRRDLGLAILYITHDLGVVASMADRVLVLERGRLCEAGAVGSVLAQPRNAYTTQLLRAAPSVSQAIGQGLVGPTASRSPATTEPHS
ncbi:ABC transporter ATP-binding protein [Streptomyces phaeochromogenes]|uniref:ABC transporter ATP-binding protein n=1 Tax=Streptomyces phaeochromogenes TaxID=1923 RepID=UPI002DD83319|nr:ABC transporter ATP-binding protein [Streptomyces phaeochromogenes]WRZ34620.1 ABC transporter ATP-binding protein [Streptomyces phaeochromogenes]